MSRMAGAAGGRKYSRRVQVKIAQWYADREERGHAEELEAAIEKRRRCRLRLWECEKCGQKIRASTDSLDVVHFTDGGRFELRTVRLPDSTPF